MGRKNHVNLRPLVILRCPSMPMHSEEKPDVPVAAHTHQSLTISLSAKVFEAIK